MSWSHLEAADAELMARRRELERELTAAEHVVEEARRRAEEARRRLYEFDEQHPALRRRIRGDRIRHAREQMRLSRTMFARIAGVSPATIYALERGTRRDHHLVTIKAVSDTFGMSIDQLWCGRERRAVS